MFRDSATGGSGEISMFREMVAEGPPPEARRVVSAVMTGVPSVVACGLVDLETGGWIHLDSAGPHPEDFLGFLAQQTRELFEGDGVRTIQSVLCPHAAATDTSRDIQDLVMRTPAHLHYFTRMQDDPTVVLAVVARRSVRLGLLLGALRDSVSHHIGAGL